MSFAISLFEIIMFKSTEISFSVLPQLPQVFLLLHPLYRPKIIPINVAL